MDAAASPEYPAPVTAESAVQEKVWEACQEGDLQSVNDFLNSPEHRRNVDSWFHPEFDQNALHIAALHGHQEVVEALVKDHLINPNTQTANLKKTALHLACDECHEQVIRVLLANGADPNLQMSNLQTPLHRAARWGSINILKNLIGRGSRLDDLDEDGNTALHVAAGNGRPTMVNLLIERGANLSLLNNKGKTAWDIAVEKGYYWSKYYLDRGSRKLQNLPLHTCYPDRQLLVTGKSSPAIAGQVFDKQKKQNRPAKLGSYPMIFPCGHCIIVNNVEFVPDCLPRRDGSDKDAAALQQVFGDLLGFRCRVKTNLTAQQIKETMATYRDMDHSEYSCLVVAILSHGNHEGILGVDGESVSVEKITSYFVASECQKLVNKPKIFILQACRGGQCEVASRVPANSKDAGAIKGDSASDSDLPCSPDKEDGTVDSYFKVIPNMADYILAYSTMPGCISYRSDESGSWFIQHLTKVLMEYADSESFLDMLTEVNRRVAMETSDKLEVQIPSPQFSLRYKLFFFVRNKPKLPKPTGVAEQRKVYTTVNQEESQLVYQRSS